MTDLSEIKINQYIVNSLLNHACCCKEKWCWCKASTFRDAICDLSPFVSREKKRTIEEVLQND